MLKVQPRVERREGGGEEGGEREGEEGERREGGGGGRREGVGSRVEGRWFMVGGEEGASADTTGYLLNVRVSDSVSEMLQLWLLTRDRIRRIESARDSRN